jgi:hypothetical protein
VGAVYEVWRPVAALDDQAAQPVAVVDKLRRKT